jgi:hypothetical protein
MRADQVALRAELDRICVTVRWAFAPDAIAFVGGILRPMTTPSENHPSGELLLVAIVEMAPANAAAGQRYEDTVLGLLDRHGGCVERRMRSMDSATEVHIIRFRSRAGYESFIADPDRLDYRGRIGDAAPTTRVLEVRELDAHTQAEATH